MNICCSLDLLLEQDGITASPVLHSRMLYQLFALCILCSEVIFVTSDIQANHISWLETLSPFCLKLAAPSTTNVWPRHNDFGTVIARISFWQLWNMCNCSCYCRFWFVWQTKGKQSERHQYLISAFPFLCTLCIFQVVCVGHLFFEHLVAFHCHAGLLIGQCTVAHVSPGNSTRSRTCLLGPWIKGRCCHLDF